MKAITKPLHKAKIWMESFSDKPSAMQALFWLSFAESSFFPIPPDVLLLAIGVSKPEKALKAALWCTLGSILGAIVGYLIGFGLMESLGQGIIEFYGAEGKMAQFGDVFAKWGYWFLGIAAFTPIPFKVATIASGMMEMNLALFVLISSIGRAGRFFLVASLLYFKGPTIKEFIEKYFDIISIAFVVLLVGGFVLIKFVL